MKNSKLINEEARFIIRGFKDSLVVLLAAGASMASMYFFYHS
ncbi:MAG: hypothetical protein ACO1N7_00295 [Sphingobacteriaceae bacterium]